MDHSTCEIASVATYKAYVAIFVCIVTKAVHIELVEDLTTSFIAVLKKFVARREKVSNLYSDNGRNFIRAEHIATNVGQRRIQRTYPKVRKTVL